FSRRRVATFIWRFSMSLSSLIDSSPIPKCPLRWIEPRTCLGPPIRDLLLRLDCVGHQVHGHRRRSEGYTRLAQACIHILKHLLGNRLALTVIVDPELQLVLADPAVIPTHAAEPNLALRILQ